MTRQIKLYLSQPQLSAFECRDWLAHDVDEAPCLAAHLHWSNPPITHLKIPFEHALRVADELTQLANVEDAGAQEDRRAGCKAMAQMGSRACRSFTALAGRLIREYQKREKKTT